MINTKRLTNIKISPRTLIRHAVTEESKYPRPLRTHSKGLDILHDPLWNKGMGFPIAERDRLGLRGLLPPIVKTQAQQLERALAHVCIYILYIVYNIIIL